MSDFVFGFILTFPICLVLGYLTGYCYATYKQARSELTYTLAQIKEDIATISVRMHS